MQAYLLFDNILRFKNRQDKEPSAAPMTELDLAAEYIQTWDWDLGRDLDWKLDDIAEEHGYRNSGYIVQYTLHHQDTFQ